MNIAGVGNRANPVFTQRQTQKPMGENSFEAQFTALQKDRKKDSSEYTIMDAPADPNIKLHKSTLWGEEPGVNKNADGSHKLTEEEKEALMAKYDVDNMSEDDVKNLMVELNQMNALSHKELGLAQMRVFRANGEITSEGTLLETDVPDVKELFRQLFDYNYLTLGIHKNEDGTLAYQDIDLAHTKVNDILQSIKRPAEA